MSNAIMIVALTLFGEASGEPWEGKMAVASVIWHRAQGDPARLVGVCRAAEQFSCWNNGRTPTVPDDPASLAAWQDCLGIARVMAAGGFLPSIAADHYHNFSVRPRWARSMQHVADVGGHRFWRAG
jgi:spore germination cell wall hydrolase CwlJ-like protein